MGPQGGAHPTAVSPGAPASCRTRGSGRKPALSGAYTLIRQLQIAPDLLVMELAADLRALPGQFLHVAVGPGMLRRPFSVYRSGDGRAEILYRVKGTGTRIMATWGAGVAVDILGPLGRPFRAPWPGERVLLVGGGIGVAPLAHFAQCYPGTGAAVFGFRGAGEVCAADRAAAAGYDVVVTTLDGSDGVAGTVLSPLEGGTLQGRFDRILTCGPWPMMAAVAAWAKAAGLACEAALEREMGCGIGACLGCVVETTDPKRPYARVCTEGPVMDVREVAWN
ncbi:MAG: dihydroorotate dehydrogenase electron transfer subunit, partial [Candidatus Sericytochromatia bacterium]|nr:dihydroorotate dehydrogenase electron transfer subunit [Candidatus Tanganyikabacteria bacterium]